MKNHRYDVTSDTLEETLQKLIAKAKTKFDLFKEQRDTEKFDESMQTLDGMFRCFQNTALADQESHKAMGTNTDGDDDPKANVGSVRFHRKVNQDMATITTMINSMKLPWRYSPRSNPNIFGDDAVAKDSTAVMNVLAEYAWEQSGAPERVTEFGAQIGKFANVPVRATFESKEENVYVHNPKSNKGEWKKVVTECYPSWDILSYHSLYADLWGGPIKDQEWVFVLTPVSRKYMQELRSSKKISEEAYKRVVEKMNELLWDGSTGADFRKEQKKNSGGTDDGPTNESGLFLMWEIYCYIPVSKSGEWDADENDYVLHYVRALGNELGEAAEIVSMERDFDPDNAIPIEMIWMMPDDAGLLYHMPPGLAVRSMYSVECTLWNHAIDNAGAIADPMLGVVPDALATKPENLRHRKGGVVQVQTGYKVGDVIQDMPPNNVIESCARLIDLLQGEQQVAGNTNSNQQGENFGGRMSATEGMIINRLSRQPELVLATYAVKKLLRFLSRKYYRYMQAYMPQSVVEAVANEMLDYPVYVTDNNEDDRKYPKGMPLVGMFDTKMDLLDEFQDDFLETQQEINLMGTMATNQRLSDSEDHHVNFGAWVKSLFRRRKIRDADLIIGPSFGNDARLRQRDELRQMEQGIAVEVAPTDNDEHHLAEIEAWRIEWKPIIGLADGELEGLSAPEQEMATHMRNIYNQLILPHYEAHKAQLSQKQAQQQAQAQQAQQAIQQTPGQITGNTASAVMGAAQ